MYVHYQKILLLTEDPSAFNSIAPYVDHMTPDEIKRTLDTCDSMAFSRDHAADATAVWAALNGVLPRPPAYHGELHNLAPSSMFRWVRFWFRKVFSLGKYI